MSLWQSCLTHLRDDLSPMEFNAWILPLRAQTDGEQVQLYANNAFLADVIRDRYLARIEQACRHHGLTNPVISVWVEGQQPQPSFQAAVAAAPLSFATPVEAVVDAPNNQQQAFYGQRLDPLSGAAAVENPASRPQSNINPNLTFANFVEGKSNQLARAAAAQVGEKPGMLYNPLYIYGGTGLGKTHLLHAVGNTLLERNPHAVVVYITANQFLRDMVSAITNKRTEDFKAFFRNVDALLIDDIQMLSDKMRAQEEIFLAFNTLLEGKHQIVLTSDRYPKELEKFEDRLKSRFAWGLTAAVEPPELETRVAILMTKAQEANFQLAHEVAFFIAKRLPGNVRDLEGAFNRISAHYEFTGREIDIESARDALRDMLAAQDKLVTIENIMRTVAEYYRIKMSDLTSKRRSRSVARPRQMAMALAKELTNHSYPEIGEAFGGRDHTTVLHACRKIEQLRDESHDFKEDYTNLIRILSA